MNYLLSTRLSTISLKKYCQKSLKNMIRNGKWKSWCTRSVMCGSSKKISFHHHLLQEVGEVFVSYHIQQEDPGARWAKEQWEQSFFWNCNKWFFVTKIVQAYWEKKMFYWLRKTFEIWGWRPRICKTRAIYSNSERSEQFLVTECFFKLFLKVSHI